MKVAEFERLESHLHGSALVRAADAVGRIGLAAARHSATARRLHGLRERVARLPPAAQLRSAAVFVATATLAHLLLLPVVPPHIAPALPKAIWILVGVTAIVTAAVANRLAGSWASSAARAMWRTITFPESRKPAHRREP